MPREVTGVRKGGMRKTGGNAARGSDTKMSEHRESWVDLPSHSFICFLGHDEDWLKWKASRGEAVEYNPDHPPVRIEVRQPGRKMSSFVIALTNLTVDELDVLKEFLNRAIDMARPVCAYYDEAAKEAFENGDPGYVRLYRPIPQLYVRERLLTEHRESVQSRFTRSRTSTPSPDLGDVFGPRRDRDSADSDNKGDDRVDGGSVPDIDQGGAGSSDSL